jgi:hypothetical protein
MNVFNIISSESVMTETSFMVALKAISTAAVKEVQRIIG